VPELWTFDWLMVIPIHISGTQPGVHASTIAVVPEGATTPRKLTKIVSLNGGGFSVLAPYHKARSGFLCKIPVDPSSDPPESREWKAVDGFTAESRAKLSYHVDGFAQFSSERQGELLSGRDPHTGEPKGLGLMTHPLANPIWSGPSAMVTVWGLDDFEPLTNPKGSIVFQPQDCYFRACDPSDANGWVLSIYVFPICKVPPCQYLDGECVCDVAIDHLNGPLACVMRLKVVRLQKENVFLGLAMNRAVLSFPSSSGWIINGPGDYSAAKKGHALMACYPRDSIPVVGRLPLDRNAPKG
jgi:hypothetical protein